MAKYIVILCILFPLNALAQKQLGTCSRGSGLDLALSKDEIAKVLSNQPGSDPVLREAAAIEKARGSPNPGAERAATTINWDQARKLVLIGAVIQLVALHDRVLFLTTRTGRTFRTKQPHIDAIWKLRKLVDPCSVFIDGITE